MTGFVLRRLASLPPLLLLASLAFFAMLRLGRGDPALDYLRLAQTPPTDAAVAAARAELGPDRPLLAQYGAWLGDASRGDLGASWFTRQPVAAEIARHPPATLQLAGAAMLPVLLVGVPLGIWAALRRDRWPDHATRVVASLGVSLPNFWLGFLPVLLFAATLGWLPAMGRDGPASIVLPAVATAAMSARVMLRLTRAAVLGALGEPHLRFARARGLPRRALLGRRYRPVLDDAALHVGPGECVAPLGPTGSGKSTLGRILLGPERPDAGEVTFVGAPLLDRRGRVAPALRRSLRAFFQDPHGATSPRLTGFEVVAEPLLADRLPRAALREQVAALLSEVGLGTAVMDRLAHRLSGGRLQRLCIARALAPPPRLVVLDEAVGGLDLETQARVMELLRALHRRGVAYLFIIHNLRLLRGFADRCYVRQDRRAVEVADPFGAAPVPPVLAALRGAILPARPARAV